jgi:hypothetical protein
VAIVATYAERIAARRGAIVTCSGSLDGRSLEQGLLVLPRVRHMPLLTIDHVLNGFCVIFCEVDDA